MNININADIVSEIYDSKRLSNEIYKYLCSVIENELKKSCYENINDKLISNCVDELVKLE